MYTPAVSTDTGNSAERTPTAYDRKERFIPVTLYRLYQVVGLVPLGPQREVLAEPDHAHAMYAAKSCCGQLTHFLRYSWPAVMVLFVLARALRNMTPRHHDAVGNAGLWANAVAWSLSQLVPMLGLVVVYYMQQRQLLQRLFGTLTDLPTVMHALDSEVPKGHYAKEFRAQRKHLVRVQVGITLATTAFIYLTFNIGRIGSLIRGECGTTCEDSTDDWLWERLGSGYLLFIIVSDLFIIGLSFVLFFSYALLCFRVLSINLVPLTDFLTTRHKRKSAQLGAAASGLRGARRDDEEEEEDFEEVGIDDEEADHVGSANGTASQEAENGTAQRTPKPLPVEEVEDSEVEVEVEVTEEQEDQEELDPRKRQLTLTWIPRRKKPSLPRANSPVVDAPQHIELVSAPSQGASASPSAGARTPKDPPHIQNKVARFHTTDLSVVHNVHNYVAFSDSDEKFDVRASQRALIVGKHVQTLVELFADVRHMATVVATMLTTCLSAILALHTINYLSSKGQFPSTTAFLPPIFALLCLVLSVVHAPQVYRLISILSHRAKALKNQRKSSADTSAMNKDVSRAAETHSWVVRQATIANGYVINTVPKDDKVPAFRAVLGAYLCLLGMVLAVLLVSVAVCCILTFGAYPNCSTFENRSFGLPQPKFDECSSSREQLSIWTRSLGLSGMLGSFFVVMVWRQTGRWPHWKVVVPVIAVQMIVSLLANTLYPRFAWYANAIVSVVEVALLGHHVENMLKEKGKEFSRWFFLSVGLLLPVVVVAIYVVAVPQFNQLDDDSARISVVVLASPAALVITRQITYGIRSCLPAETVLARLSLYPYVFFFSVQVFFALLSRVFLASVTTLSVQIFGAIALSVAEVSLNASFPVQRYVKGYFTSGCTGRGALLESEMWRTSVFHIRLSHCRFFIEIYSIAFATLYVIIVNAIYNLSLDGTTLAVSFVSQFLCEVAADIASMLIDETVFDRNTVSLLWQHKEHYLRTFGTVVPIVSAVSLPGVISVLRG